MANIAVSTVPLLAEQAAVSHCSEPHCLASVHLTLSRGWHFAAILMTAFLTCFNSCAFFMLIPNF